MDPTLENLDQFRDDCTDLIPTVPGAVIIPAELLEDIEMEDPVGPPKYNPAKSLHAPLRAPIKNDILYVHWNLPRYRSWTDARARIRDEGQFAMGVRYYVYKRMANGFINLTEKPGVYGYWAHPDDINRPVGPKYEDWHKLDSYVTPLYYQAKREAPIIDLEERHKPLRVLESQAILIAGLFKGPDGKIYAAPHETYKLGQWYGLLLEHLDPFKLPMQVEQPDVKPIVPTKPAEPIVYAPLPFTARLGIFLHQFRKDVLEVIRSFKP